MTSDEAPPIRAVIGGVGALCREMGRQDLSLRIEDALGRTDREALVLAVTGEFKRGKSSLVNGLLGASLCPTVPDRSTAVPTIFRNGNANSVTLTVADGEGQRLVTGELAELPGMVLEDDRASSGVRRLVAVVETPNRFLERGFSLIDTPGVGGLSTGFGEAARNLAGIADAAIVVADSGAPLSPDTISFIEQLVRTCPAVLVALTRGDLYRNGGSAEEIKGQIAAKGLPVQVVAVSNPLRLEALRAGDRDLNDQSGYPALLDAVQAIAARRSEAAWGVAVAAADSALTALSHELERHEALVSAPEPDWEPNILEARTALETARKDGARWPTVLNEGISDASTAAEFDLRAGLRQAAKEFEEELELTSGAPRVDELRGRVQARAQTVLSSVFEALDAKLAGVERHLHSLFEGEPGDSDPAVSPPALPSEWGGVQGRESGGLKSAAGSVYSSLRGAQSGIMLVGVFAGVAGFGIGTLALVGIGAAFGGKQIMDERGKRAQVRKQQTRAALRQFLDEVQVDGSRAIRELAKEELRHQREVIGELAMACIARRTERLRVLQEERERTGAERQALARDLQARRAKIADLRNRLSTGARP